MNDSPEQAEVEEAARKRIPGVLRNYAKAFERSDAEAKAGGFATLTAPDSDLAPILRKAAAEIQRLRIALALHEALPMEGCEHDWSEPVVQCRKCRGWANQA